MQTSMFNNLKLKLVIIFIKFIYQIYLIQDNFEKF